METSQVKPKKVHVSLSITKEAQDILFDWGYASERTVGAFVSELIVEHHQRVQRAKTNTPPTPAEVAQELRRLADLLDVSPTG